MARKIIIDCDNTFSVEGCDLDDGLAIIYSLAQKDLELLGVGTTFGNNKIDVVYPNTLRFMKDIGHSHIPVFKGSENNHEDNKAAHFLVEMADRYNGQVSVLATGSLTNLYHAWKLDNEFYDKVKDISLMGGITEPLIINNKILKELNFSCNWQAALNVLQHGNSITIATGNTCLDGFFTSESFMNLKEGNDFEKWLYSQAQYWFEREKDVFDNDGIYIWDVFAAAALLNPDLFINDKLNISPDEESMKQGFLIGKGKEKQVTIPKIKNTNQYIRHVYDQFRIFGDKVKP